MGGRWGDKGGTIGRQPNNALLYKLGDNLGDGETMGRHPYRMIYSNTNVRK